MELHGRICNETIALLGSSIPTKTVRVGAHHHVTIGPLVREIDEDKRETSISLAARLTALP